MRRRIEIFGIVGLLCLSLAGCGSKEMGMSATDCFSETTSATADSGYFKSDEMYATTENDTGAGVTQNTQAIQDQRKLIKSVDLNVETQDYDNLLTNLQDKVTRLGGYMENFSTNGSDMNRYANMTARIPADKLDGFISEVAEISNITYRNESVEDVTLTYVDLDSHKRMLKAEEDRLLTLMEQADTIEDMITIENSLTDVRYQIESMESQLRTFDNQVDFSTVTISVEEVVRMTPQTQKTAIERMQTGFMESLYKVGDGLKEFGINFVICLPYIIVFGIIVLLIFVIIKICVAIDRKKAKKVATKRQNQNMQNEILKNGYLAGQMQTQQIQPQQMAAPIQSQQNTNVQIETPNQKK